MDKKQLLENAENPEKFTGIRITIPSETAAGIPGVVSAMKHVFGEMGIGRGLKVLAKLNQKGGTDCPSCAWPDPDDERSSIAEYCENGAKAVADEATSKRLTPEFFKENSIYDLSLLSDFEIGKMGRVAQPMILRKGETHYSSISWDDAFETIAGHLKSLDHPDEAVFYTSGRASNEAAFLYQLFVREFGTNNLPDCSNMCHESSGVALSESVGIGKGSVKLEDFYKTDVILILGQNPGTNHPRMLSALQKAKENGSIIISVNPLLETGLLGFANPQELKGMLGIRSSLSDIYLQVKINGDMALLKAIMLLMLEMENEKPGSVFDKRFIEEKTFGYQAFIDNLKTYDYEELCHQSGISDQEIRKVVEILSTKEKIIACWAMGLTQHKNSVETIQDLVNLLLLKGSIGKPGAGTCPVRGHSNVQGDRTMGIYEKPSKQFLDSLRRVFKFNPPEKHGYDVVECIKAMHDGDAKVFFALGGNFLSATPDTLYTARALRNCKLTVHVSTKLNRSHLIHGETALILPCYGRTDIDTINGKEQFVSTENSMGVIQSSRGSVRPISDNLLSEPIIVCRLAKAVFGDKSNINWGLYMRDYDYIRDSIEACIPGFHHYNERIRIKGGFYLPNGARDNDYKTDIGKAKFTVSKLESLKMDADELLMMTIRSHDQFNTTVYGLHDRYRGIHNERRVILINAKDIERLGFKNGDVVDLFNYHEGIERVAHKFLIVEYNIPEQCVATYFPEANVLVPINSTARKSNTPTSKSVIIKLRPHLTT